ncbi:hypothetical protein [Bdellovibrio sp. HCB-110]|uniref:hypothetical protein n=1 Tax=Bdellovibrio sp. HCB-110 TaxID=3391182 RepID=UPI0039B3AD92
MRNIEIEQGNGVIQEEAVKKSGGLKTDQAPRLKDLENENMRQHCIKTRRILSGFTFVSVRD